MPTQVIMPRFGETVVDGTVSRWLKAEGERIEKMETLLEVSTDKIDSEIPSPAGGVILRILVPAGKTVDAGTILAYIGQPGEEVGESGSRGAGEAALGPSVFASSSAVPAAKPSGRAFVSPVVARIAAEHDVDVNQIPGTGMGGRVTKKDILAFVEARGAATPVAFAPLCSLCSHAPLPPPRTKSCSLSPPCAEPLPPTWCRACAPVPTSLPSLRWT